LITFCHPADTLSLISGADIVHHAFLFFENGKLRERRVGAMPDEVFRKWIHGLISGKK